MCRNAYGRISRKIDVYAFGVVLYELISAKAAVIKIDEPSTEFKSLVDESTAEFKSLVALVILTIPLFLLFSNDSPILHEYIRI